MNGEKDTTNKQEHTRDLLNQNKNDKQLTREWQKEPTSEIVAEKTISLLEEKLLVNRNKRKVGEVVVRKKIETRMVQVPVRREVLIVEQIGEENKQLAQIDIGKGEITGVEIAHLPANISTHTIETEFLSPGSASDFLKAIALTKNHGCVKVNIELTVNSQEKLEAYQKMLEGIKTFNS